MIKALIDVEIYLYIKEYLFIYDLYKSNNRNYDITLNDISLIIDDNNNKECFHNILLEIIGIDNIKDDISNEMIKISLDNYKYSEGNITNLICYDAK